MMKTGRAPDACFALNFRRRARGRLLLPAGRRQWRNVALALVLALLAGAYHLLPLQPRGSERQPGGERDWTGTVAWVSDGDTLGVVPLAGGRPRKVRLDGIDAPESCQRFGREAGDALRRRLLHRKVQVATRDVDQYRRLLATIRIDGEDVGAWMVENGNAWSYRYRQDPGPYAVQEQRARRARLGLFQDRAPQNPYDFRQSHGPCR